MSIEITQRPGHSHFTGNGPDAVKAGIARLTHARTQKTSKGFSYMIAPTGGIFVGAFHLDQIFSVEQLEATHASMAQAIAPAKAFRAKENQA